MAKSTYKKSDRFLTNLIIGFSAFILLLVTVLVISNMVSVDYSDFDHIDNYYLIGSQEDDAYLVYYYSETCGYCNLIKEDVLAFAKNHKEDVKIYFLDAQEVGIPPFPILDPTTHEEMSGTPSLITVVNGQIVQMAPGYVNVLDVLAQIDDGTYPYLN